MRNKDNQSDPLVEMIQQREYEKNKHNFESFLKEKNLIVTTNPVSAIESVQLLSTDDVCEALKVDRHFVYSIAGTSLPGFKKKGWKFRLEDVKKYIDEMVTASSLKNDD
ncbi:MAG: helix-turn-helix domain-containing protein [Cyclobacteriaceae bacterium]|nr:helix-turn-helix domain-containing protein [Cyclobacteriaceae bacterium]